MRLLLSAVVFVCAYGVSNAQTCDQKCRTGGGYATNDTCCIQPNLTYMCCGKAGMVCCPYIEGVAPKCCNAGQYCGANNQCMNPPPDKCSVAGNPCDQSKEHCCGTTCCPIGTKDAKCCLDANGNEKDGICCPKWAQCATAADGQGCVLNGCDRGPTPVACDPSMGVCCETAKASGKYWCCGAVGGACCGDNGGCCPPNTVCDATTGGCKQPIMAQLEGKPKFIPIILPPKNV